MIQLALYQGELELGRIITDLSSHNGHHLCKCGSERMIEEAPAVMMSRRILNAHLDGYNSQPSSLGRQDRHWHIRW